MISNIGTPEIQYAITGTEVSSGKEKNSKFLEDILKVWQMTWTPRMRWFLP
jgi:hypothetical protein